MPFWPDVLTHSSGSYDEEKEKMESGLSQGLQYRFKNDPKIFAAQMIQRCLKTKARINEGRAN